MNRPSDTQSINTELFRFPANPFLRNPLLSSNTYWTETIRHSINIPGPTEEQFCRYNEHIDPDIIHAFGGPRPPAKYFLLHQAGANISEIEQPPVLLVHGAGHNANVWADLYQTGGPGLVHYLTNRNLLVFAITFSHPHGDNFFQSQQLAEAIKQIKMITGSPRVDMVVHSKGGIPARMYLSNIGKKWGTPYRGDVRRIIMLGVPNRGMDYSFRKPLVNYIIYATGASAPVSWDKMIYMGQSINTEVYSLYQKGSFPGQSQLLYRWDNKYPLEVLQPDWWTTYYGGDGVVSHSQGINNTIAGGEYLMERLEEAVVDKDVEIAVLAGNKNDFGAFFGITSGPSDGLLFIESALHTSALTRRGAKLLARDEMPVNHLELLGSPVVWNWIVTQLLN